MTRLRESPRMPTPRTGPPAGPGDLQRLVRIASLAFILSAVASVAVSRAWPEAQSALLLVLILSALGVIIAQDLVPARARTRYLPLVEGLLGVGATTVVVALTGGSGSPFAVAYLLAACAAALTQPAWLAAIVAAASVAGLGLGAWFAGGAPGLPGRPGLVTGFVDGEEALRLAIGAVLILVLAAAASIASRGMRASSVAAETSRRSRAGYARDRGPSAGMRRRPGIPWPGRDGDRSRGPEHGWGLGRGGNRPARGRGATGADALLPGGLWAPGMPLPETPTLAISVSADSIASAETTFERRQLVILALVGSGLGAAVALWPMAVMGVLAGSLTAMYVAVFIYRTANFWSGFERPNPDAIDDATARATPDADLPVYTILVPAYKEAEVIGNLLASIDRLEYPRDKLDVLLLLEADDDSTHEAARRMIDGPHVRVITIQPGGPKTKPNACNIGLTVARGRYVTIFDAEDRPEPLQLRRAVVAFERAPDNVACVQARLLYHNASQNLLTRWFAIEYSMWFRHLLPGLVHAEVPVPLGGTSNHFRRDVLEAVGAWDPWNVTEDADLGVRLHRLGYRTRMLDSTTLEEANSDVVNWIKQRSRWYKGYMQTWLVHMRNPGRLLREMGPGGFASFSLFVGGTPFISLVNPILWTATLFWFIVHPPFIQQLFSGPVYYLGLVAFLGGNFSFLYATILSARATDTPRLVFAAVLVPVYWAIMSVAATKALIQLIAAPSFWEKTLHGLDLAPNTAAPNTAAPGTLAPSAAAGAPTAGPAGSQSQPSVASPGSAGPGDEAS